MPYNIEERRRRREERQKELELEDCGLQLSHNGTYLDLEQSIDDQRDDFEGFDNKARNSVILRTRLSVRVHGIKEKLLSSNGRELRRALFSLKQLFQDDKDLVHEFVHSDGLACLIELGSASDQNYQNYILRAIGQIMLYLDGMNGVIEHNETIQWLYSLLNTQYRLVTKSALKLLLVFVEYTESNAQPLQQAAQTVDGGKHKSTWHNLMELLKDEGQDAEIQTYVMTLFNKTLNSIPDQDTFYDITDALELQGMEQVTQKLTSRAGTDLDLVEQIRIYEFALKHEDGDDDIPMEQKQSLRKSRRSVDPMADRKSMRSMSLKPTAEYSTRNSLDPNLAVTPEERLSSSSSGDDGLMAQRRRREHRRGRPSSRNSVDESSLSPAPSEDKTETLEERRARIRANRMQQASEVGSSDGTASTASTPSGDQGQRKRHKLSIKAVIREEKAPQPDPPQEILPTPDISQPVTLRSIKTQSPTNSTEQPITDPQAESSEANQRRGSRTNSIRSNSLETCEFITLGPMSPPIASTAAATSQPCWPQTVGPDVAGNSPSQPCSPDVAEVDMAVEWPDVVRESDDETSDQSDDSGQDRLRPFMKDQITDNKDDKSEDNYIPGTWPSPARRRKQRDRQADKKVKSGSSASEKKDEMQDEDEDDISAASRGGKSGARTQKQELQTKQKVGDKFGAAKRLFDAGGKSDVGRETPGRKKEEVVNQKRNASQKESVTNDKKDGNVVTIKRPGSKDAGGKSDVGRETPGRKKEEVVSQKQNASQNESEMKETADENVVTIKKPGSKDADGKSDVGRETRGSKKDEEVVGQKQNASQKESEMKENRDENVVTIKKPGNKDAVKTVAEENNKSKPPASMGKDDDASKQNTSNNKDTSDGSQKQDSSKKKLERTRSFKATVKVVTEQEEIVEDTILTPSNHKDMPEFKEENKDEVKDEEKKESPETIDEVENKSKDTEGTKEETEDTTKVSTSDEKGRKKGKQSRNIKNKIFADEKEDDLMALLGGGVSLPRNFKTKDHRHHKCPGVNSQKGNSNGLKNEKDGGKDETDYSTWPRKKKIENGSNKKKIDNGSDKKSTAKKAVEVTDIMAFLKGGIDTQSEEPKEVEEEKEEEEEEDSGENEPGEKKHVCEICGQDLDEMDDEEEEEEDELEEDVEEEQEEEAAKAETKQSEKDDYSTKCEETLEEVEKQPELFRRHEPKDDKIDDLLVILRGGISAGPPPEDGEGDDDDEEEEEGDESEEEKPDAKTEDVASKEEAVEKPKKSLWGMSWDDEKTSSSPRQESSSSLLYGNDAASKWSQLANPEPILRTSYWGMLPPSWTPYCPAEVAASPYATLPRKSSIPRSSSVTSKPPAPSSSSSRRSSTDRQTDRNSQSVGTSDSTYPRSSREYRRSTSTSSDVSRRTSVSSKAGDSSVTVPRSPTSPSTSSYSRTAPSYRRTTSIESVKSPTKTKNEPENDIMALLSRGDSKDRSSTVSSSDAHAERRRQRREQLRKYLEEDKPLTPSTRSERSSSTLSSDTSASTRTGSSTRTEDKPSSSIDISSGNVSYRRRRRYEEPEPEKTKPADAEKQKPAEDKSSTPSTPSMSSYMPRSRRRPAAETTETPAEDTSRTTPERTTSDRTTSSSENKTEDKSKELKSPEFLPNGIAARRRQRHEQVGGDSSSASTKEEETTTTRLRNRTRDETKTQEPASKPTENGDATTKPENGELAQRYRWRRDRRGESEPEKSEKVNGDLSSAHKTTEAEEARAEVVSKEPVKVATLAETKAEDQKPDEEMQIVTVTPPKPVIVVHGTTPAKDEQSNEEETKVVKLPLKPSVTDTKSDTRTSDESNETAKEIPNGDATSDQSNRDNNLLAVTDDQGGEDDSLGKPSRKVSTTLQNTKTLSSRIEELKQVDEKESEEVTSPKEKDVLNNAGAVQSVHQQLQSQRESSEQQNKEKMGPRGDVSGKISQAIEGIKTSQITPKTPTTPVVAEPEVEDKKEDEWEEVLKLNDRELRVNKWDFTDLTRDDDNDVLKSIPLMMGINPQNPTVPDGAPPPPPVPGFAPPAPPPVPGLGAPPPPPPIIGSNTFPKKKKKTVRLFWKETQPETMTLGRNGITTKTIWSQLDTVAIDNKKLEHLFESRGKDIIAKKAMEANKKNFITVLDPKRSNAINIGLTVLPQPRSIKLAILNMDSMVINKEGVEKLLTMVPTEEEVARIHEAMAANPDLPLGSAEQFLHMLSTISGLEARLNLWLFKMDYDNMEEEVAEPMADLKKGMEDLRESKTFKDVLSTLLAIGNFLNGGKAFGFNLEYLQKVPEVKDTVHKQSLLHHLCATVMDKFPDSGDLFSEIGAISRCAKVDFDQLTINLTRLEEQCKISWDHLQIISKHDSHAQIKTKLHDFLGDCAKRIIVLKIVHRRVSNRFNKFLLFLGMSTSAAREIKISDFCRIISEFALEYRTTRERIVEQEKKKANHRKRNKTRGKMITENFSISKDSAEDAKLKELLSSQQGTAPGDETLQSRQRARPSMIRRTLKSGLTEAESKALGLLPKQPSSEVKV